MKFSLHWIFINNHEWHRLFDTEEEAMKAVYDFGLLTHPDIKRIKLKEVDELGMVVCERVVI